MSKLCKILSLVLFFCYGTQIFAQKYILHLPMAGHAEDWSSNKNNGTIIGGVISTEDRFGNPCGALNFNGTNGFISIPHSASLGSIKKHFSVSVWMKLDPYPVSENLRWLTLICKGELPFETSTMPQYRVQVFQGNTQSTVSINTEFTENDWDFKKHNLEYDKWYHIVLTYDGSKVKFYINSEIAWSGSYHEKLSPNTAPVNIGRDIPGATEFFKGSMSDFRLYDGALSKSQIDDLYTHSKSYGYDKSMAFTCPKNQVVQTIPGKCHTIANLGEPTGESPCDGAKVRQISGAKNGDILQVGEENIVYEIYNDLGVNRNCAYSVTVRDKEAPVIEPLIDTFIYVSKEEKSLSFIYQLPNATDNCQLKDVQVIQGKESGREFPLGTTLLKFQATDIYGNIGFGQYNVHILQDSEEVIPESPDTPETAELISEDPFESKLDQIPITPGSKIEIDDLLFAADKTKLSRLSNERLDIVVKFMNRYPNVSIEIGGHTNGIPTKAYCEQLSTARAKTCYEYLISKGIAKDRLKYKGYGKSHLKFPADYRNPLNQRVELTILEVK